MFPVTHNGLSVKPRVWLSVFGTEQIPTGKVN